ncbi:MAG: hypothetical protein CFK49_09470 [Armatimonadetes bacterium JP3_11]|jgi:FkbM family methyltransferase|nr:MAG: hypothetical protein CFK49_09470 [Armatimonadetes bacterium JP3_11]RMH10784.1 MAG: FkbM family methyltransferase [Armatimonadota bacterium]
MRRTLRYYASRPRELWRNRHKIRLWRRLTYWAIQQFGVQEKFTASYYGARFYPFPSSLSKAIWLFGEQFRRQDMLFLRDLLRPGDILLDVGANIGTHSICLAPVLGEEGAVYSFEPHPRIFGYFQKNIQLNQIRSIYAYNVALGHQNGIANLSDDVLDDRNWLHASVGKDSGVEVPVHTLDAFPIRVGNRIIKVDVEGYELYVFRGAEQTLEATQFIYLEIGDRHTLRCGYTTHELLDFLKKRGWRLFRFQSPSDLAEIDAKYTPPDVENIVAARDVAQLHARLNQYRIRLLK